MALHNSVKRYMLLIEKTRRGYPSMKELIAFFESHEMAVSARTLQRDFNRLRTDYQMDIAYHKNKNGYRLNDETSVDIDQFLRFLDILHTADLIYESAEKTRETLKYVDFETDTRQRGSHLLKPLLQALLEKREIEFTHKSFFRSEPNTYRVQPYLLKEYLNRYYLVGRVKELDADDEKENFRTFGIDRITELTVSTLTFTPLRDTEPKSFFDHVVGLTYSTSTLQDVVLSFSPTQGEYVKSLPWHHSQKVLIDNDEELRIVITVKPNFELTQKILMQGSNVAVLEPIRLKEEVKKHLQKALKKYAG